MKLTIPIRGSDFEPEYESLESFFEEIPTLSNDQRLISLIDENEKDEDASKLLIDKINFQIVVENKHKIKECAELINKAFPDFKTEFILEYLIIDIELFEGTDFPIDYLGYMLNKYLGRLCFLINLSYSTNVDFLPGVIYTDTNEFFSKTEMIGSNLMYAYQHAHKIKWPTIRNLKLIDTIKWYHKFGIHPDDKSVNNVHRAINAFSHLLDDFNSEDSDNLFWIMLGIEALLSKGINAISNQIREKSTLILGKPTEYTKKLNQLYNYRSKLVHGEFNIFPSFHSDYESFEKEFDDYLAFATSILIALIREIYLQKTEFEFELKLK